MKNGKDRVHEYTAFFEANEHRGYAVTVPSLPGLVTEGKNPDHARCIAKAAIQCYIEGLKKAKEPIPVERETTQVENFRRRVGSPWIFIGQNVLKGWRAGRRLDVGDTRWRKLQLAAFDFIQVTAGRKQNALSVLYSKCGASSFK